METTKSAPTKTSERPVRVKVTPAGAKPIVFRFAVGSVTSRAAVWLQQNHPIARTTGETTAELAGGGTVVVERGGRISDLYPVGGGAAKPVPDPKPAPTPAPTPEPAKEPGPGRKPRTRGKAKGPRKSAAGKK